MSLASRSSHCSGLAYPVRDSIACGNASEKTHTNSTKQTLNFDWDIERGGDGQIKVPGAYLDNEKCPGTKKLRRVARAVAIEHNCPRYSRKIYGQILTKIKGMKIFYSSECTKEISMESMFDCLRAIYLGEKYMLTRANGRDVYFDVGNHAGTKAFIEAVKQVVVKLGVDQAFDKLAYTEIKLMLYDSEFFVGRPPNCEKASSGAVRQIFESRFNFEKKRRRRILRWERARPIPGTVWCPTKSRQLQDNVSACCAWCPYRLTCCTPCCQSRVLSLWIRCTKGLRFDPVTGTTVFERVNQGFTITYPGGYRSSLPLLVLSGVFVFLAICLIVQAIIKTILFAILIQASDYIVLTA
jgi:hypothetical protein